MPLRVSNAVEKCIVNDLTPPVHVVCPAITAKDVLPDISGKNGEWAGRYIQNVGANPAYYAFGHDCDPTNFNGILFAAGAVDANGFGSGQQLDVSNFPGRISVYSVTGTTIAITSLIRADNAQGQGGIISK
jgi:hypothetical protein